MDERRISTQSTNPIKVADSIPADQNPAAVFLAGLRSEHSRRNMARYLNQIAQLIGVNPVLVDYDGKRKRQQEVTYLYVDWRSLRYQHTAAIAARLAGAYAPATVNVMLSALRGVLYQAWKLGLTNAEDYQRAVDIKNVRGETLPTGRDLSQGEIMALVAACDRDKSASAGIRDAAIIGVLYTCGLRRSEAASLDLSDCNINEGRLIIRAGKGRKARTVYMSGGTLQAVIDWLGERGSMAGALFNPINKGGKIGCGRRMTPQAIYNILKNRAAEAGVDDFSPHDFRRTFVGDLLDRGVDIVTVQKLAGHASPTTTSRYDRRGEKAKQEAAGKLHFPYQRKRQRDPLD